MKINFYFSHAHIFYILSIGLLLISCKKDTGTLPDYSSNEPYYDLELEKEWELEIDESNVTSNLFFPTLRVVDNDIILGFGNTVSWFAVQASTGELMWSQNINEDLFQVSSAEVIELEDRYVYYNSSFCLSRNKVTGELIDKYEYRYSSDIIGVGRAVVDYNNKILLLTGQGESTGTNRLYELDPLTHTSTLLVEIEEATSPTRGDFHLNIDRSEGILPLIIFKGARSNPNIAVVKVDLNTHTYEITEFERIPNLRTDIIDSHHLLKDNNLFVPTSPPANMRIFDLNTQSEIGSLQNTSVLKHYNNNILSFSDDMMLINSETYQAEWIYKNLRGSPTIVANILDDNKRLLIFRDSKRVFIIDLEKGTLLISHQLYKSEPVITYTSNASVCHDNNLIIMSGEYLDSNKKFIRALRSPFPLEQ